MREEGTQENNNYIYFFGNLGIKFEFNEKIQEKLINKEPISIEERNKIVLNNQKLVYKIAKRMTALNENIDIDDLIQDANLGLILAIDRYRYYHETNFTFASFAVKMMVSEIIKNEYEYNSELYIPYYVYSLNRSIKKAEDDYYAKRGNFPSIRTLFNTLDWKLLSKIKISTFSEIYNAYNIKFYSLDDYEIIVGKYEKNLIDYIILKEEFMDSIKKILNKKYVDIISMKYGLGNYIKEHSLKEVAKKYKVTPTRISIILNIIFEKLKIYLRATKFNEFLQLKEDDYYYEKL